MTDLTTNCAECGAPASLPCETGCICGCQSPEPDRFTFADHVAAYGYGLA